MANKNGIRTSSKVATAASRALKDARTSNATKIIAGSTLSNRAKKTK